MPDVPPSLVGTWEKRASPPCADRFPPILVIDEHGLYSGRPSHPGTFMLWDDGTMRLHGTQHLAISTATDAIITYEFVIEDDVVTFTSPEGCVFSYRRMPK